MPEHRIITGPFNTALEDSLARDVADAKAADPLAPVVVLVGSNMLGMYLARMLARRGASHAGIRFLTPKRRKPPRGRYSTDSTRTTTSAR
jgi:hypothetical protein